MKDLTYGSISRHVFAMAAPSMDGTRECGRSPRAIPGLGDGYREQWMSRKQPQTTKLLNHQADKLVAADASCRNGP